MLRGWIICAIAALTMPAAKAGKNLTTLDSAVETLDYHLRLAPDRHSDAVLTLLWDYADSLNHSALRLDVPSLISADDLLGTVAAYSLHRVEAGRDSTIASGTVSIAYRPAGNEGLSAVLRVFDGRAYVDFGSANAEKSIAVKFSNTPGMAIGYECTRPLREIRNLIRLTAGESTAMADFDSVDSLIAHVRASSDPVEGLWTYLDRDIDPSQAELSGNYSLATIARGDGAYDIVYLSGAKAYIEQWKPLHVKGRLTPTIFEHHFDLQWRTANGKTLREDTSATLELDGTVLRLDFPLAKSSLRFRRAK